MALIEYLLGPFFEAFVAVEGRRAQAVSHLDDEHQSPSLCQYQRSMSFDMRPRKLPHPSFILCCAIDGQHLASQGTK